VARLRVGNGLRGGASRARAICWLLDRGSCGLFRAHADRAARSAGLIEIAARSFMHHDLNVAEPYTFGGCPVCRRTEKITSEAAVTPENIFTTVFGFAIVATFTVALWHIARLTAHAKRAVEIIYGPFMARRVNTGIVATVVVLSIATGILFVCLGVTNGFE
jgi:hypothetical protein